MQNYFYLSKPNGIDKNNFNCHGAIIWNDLPNNIKGVNNRNSFKFKVKQHLRTEAHLNETRQRMQAFLNLTELL